MTYTHATHRGKEVKYDTLSSLWKQDDGRNS